MRIVIHDYCGHPFPLDLSRELVARGHQVLHLYTAGYLGPKGDFDGQQNPALTVKSIKMKTINQKNLVVRFFREMILGRRIMPEIESFHPDVVISANTPLLAQRVLLRWAKRHNVLFVFWLQDLISLAIQSILGARFGTLVWLPGMLYRRLEKQLLLESNRIVAISSDFVDVLEEWGVPRNKIQVINNWAVLQDIPLLAQENAFSREHGIAGKFVVMYTGTMAFKHNPYLIIDAARELHAEEDIIFVVVSEGIGMEYLKREKAIHHLTNLILLPYQPFSRLQQVLASASAFFVTLDKSAGIFSVPSKVWSGYCAGRPSILAVPDSNLAARVTQREQCGIVIEPDSSSGFVKAILRLRGDHELQKQMGSNARSFAEKQFDIRLIADRFESLIMFSRDPGADSAVT